MVVIDMDGKVMADCNEIKVQGNIITAYVAGCQGCMFEAAQFETAKDADVVFSNIVNRLSKGLANCIDFRDYKS